MFLIKNEKELDDAVYYAREFIYDLLDSENPAFIYDEEGTEELAEINLPILAKNPDLKFDAERYVDFVASRRIDWEDAQHDFWRKQVTDSILELNKRPEVVAMYAYKEIPPIESNESYVWLDKLYGRPERVSRS